MAGPEPPADSMPRPHQGGGFKGGLEEGVVHGKTSVDNTSQP